ncbi:hypothetical protein VC83_07619 [Pseudogymnoascus destructans]|uniref:Uncharacterized protein n=2 Tax=Pseudogymnoascus destructans TaxID=655981 RepID=L8GD54_PSED2|nr:uncharacterized protein VC83_07619 [Pseudogymnoascus destructans]ELR10613.1 hypothetical protein GMDG_04882 [Pseudogymnoascus destructans 20631-21]OAF55591.1 hypothetical protein VC83_07619 [Pseudogymnoascus destructans]
MRVPVRVHSAPQGDPARARQPASKLPTTQVLDETYPTATFQVHGKEDLFTASGSKNANRASPEAAQQAQQAQREQEAAQKAQQEQVVKETFNKIQGEEDLFEAEDRVSLASEVENGQARTETLADTSHIKNHSYIETGQARTGNLAESELLEDGKSLSLAPRDEKNEANTASLSKLVRLEPLSAEEIEKQKDVKTAQTSGGPKSQSTLPILHVFDKSHLADIGEEEDNNVSDTESIMSGVDNQPHIEERGNDVGGQSQKEPLPKEVYEIRSRMGGRDGPLFALIDARLQGKDDDAAANLLRSLAGEVETFCDAKGISFLDVFLPTPSSPQWQSWLATRCIAFLHLSSSIWL